MEKIGSYYQSSIYSKNAQNAKDADRTKTENAKNANSANESKKAPVLSKAAQNLLKELKKTYKNMDFMVADFETDEEAASLLSKGTGEYSALFTPRGTGEDGGGRGREEQESESSGQRRVQVGRDEESAGGQGGGRHPHRHLFR